MCAVRIGRRKASGKALLESDHILVRLPNERLKIPFADITKIATKDGALRLDHKRGSAILYLGLAAARWADKIRNPRPLMDKLGVKPGMHVSVVGVDDETFLVQLASRLEEATTSHGAALDMIFFGTDNSADLARLSAFKRTLKSDGAIWVVHRKGKDATIKDVDVFDAAKRAGLIDNKVVAFSATHTAERLVIPVKDRAGTS